MSEILFTHTQDQLKQIAQDVLRFAKEKGATDATVEVSEGSGLAVGVRKGSVDTIEQNKDKGMGVVIYLGEKRLVHSGHASTSDFSQQSLKETVDAAYNIAKFTAIDDCSGLPEENLFEKNPRDLELCFPWDLSVDEAIDMAKRCEDAAFSVDQRITNSEGAGVYSQISHFVMANTLGFVGGYPSSRHTISVAPIAGKGSHMQRDYWYSSSRIPKKLANPESIGRYAAERSLARLNPKKLSTRQCPVLFEAPLAAGLVGAFVQAVSGGALYRKSTFLLDSIGKTVFAPHIQLKEDPFVMAGMGSSPFDDEGVQVRARDVVKDGTVQGYFLSSYTGRKLNMPTTGNSGGSHNLTLTSTKTTIADTFQGMLQKMGTGLLVTELLGQGVNYVTGDYSRGASGFWVENGQIQYPVEEITIAGNLKDMFAQIVAIGNDALIRGNKETGSILIENMTIAGA